MLKRLCSATVLLAFLFTIVVGPNGAWAQSVFLPEPGSMVQASASFVPAMIKGLTVQAETPMSFDFIVDTGNAELSAEQALRAESETLVKYFLASLTIPENDQWVNLSPYEKNRMMTDGLERTVLGRDLLAQDYVLKQVTASMIYPDEKVGRDFWQRVYDRAQKEFGTTDVKVDTFNKVWIVADRAAVYVHKDPSKKGELTAVVTDAHLKVMLESDYLAEKSAGSAGTSEASVDSKSIIREIVIPELEKEVNEGKNFANLRQIYNSVILATWYKRSLKKSFLSTVYADQARTGGVETASGETNPEEIWSLYEKAYQKGVFNLVREETDVSGQIVPRKYVSGGAKIVPAVVTEGRRAAPAVVGNLQRVHVDGAMAKAAAVDEASQVAQRLQQTRDKVATLEAEIVRLREFIQNTDSMDAVRSARTEINIRQDELRPLRENLATLKVLGARLDLPVEVLTGEVGVQAPASAAMTVEKRISDIAKVSRLGVNAWRGMIDEVVLPELKAVKVSADDVSLVETAGGMVVLGPVNERDPQYISIVLPEGDAKLAQDLKAAAAANADIQIVERALGEGQRQLRVSVSPSNLPAQREVLRRILDNTVEGDEIQIAPDLVHRPKAIALTPAGERQAFVARAEQEFLSDFRKSAEQAKVDYKELSDFFEDVKAGRPAKFVLTKELIVKWKVKEDLVKNLKDLAKKALAGMRATQNPLNPADLTKVMNILLTLLTSNELAEMALSQADKDGNTNPQAIVAGEVRYNTPIINTLLARRLAAMGLTVHSPKQGDYVPIGVASFITTVDDILMTLYGTSSHAARMIFAYKMMGFVPMELSDFEREALIANGEDPKKFERATSEGAQLLVDQMEKLAEGVAVKIDRVLETGEPLVFELAAQNDPRIQYDIDNPEHQNNNDVSRQYSEYLQSSYLSPEIVSQITNALNAGMLYGYSQGNGASTGFNRRVFNQLFGRETAEKIEMVNIHPDSFFSGTGMSNYNPKAPKNEKIARYVADNQSEIDAFFAARPTGFSLTAALGTETSVFFQVYPAAAEDALLRSQQMPYIRLSNGNLLAYYVPKLFDISQDVSLLEVVANSDLPARLLNKPFGYILATTDPDGDRYVVLQVEKNDPETVERLKALNVAFLEISADRIVVVYVPNQNFFDIEHSLIQTLKQRGEFRQDQPDFDEYNEVTYFGVSTTVSTNMWRDLWKKYKVPTVLVPVGFKEIARMEQLVEEQVRINERRIALGLGKKRVVVHDVFGNPIDLGYNPRLLFAGEESGGMVVGKTALMSSRDGSRMFLAWREKSAVEANALFLKMISEMFNATRAKLGLQNATGEQLYANPQFVNEISLSRQLRGKIEAQNSVNTAELRADATLVDLMTLNRLPKDEAKAYQNAATVRRDANDAFWVSIAFAYGEGNITLDEAREIVVDALGNDPEVLNVIKGKTGKNEEEIRKILADWFKSELVDILFQGDGVYFKFKSGGYAINRPSGTDPKIKGYPSTHDPIISAVLGNGVSNLNPVAKTPELWNKIFSVKRPDLLNASAVIKEKEAKYFRGLEVDRRVSWQKYVQRVVNDDETFQLRRDMINKGVGSSDLTIALGPRLQKEPLVYVSDSGRLLVRWDVDEELTALGSSNLHVQRIFKGHLSSMKTVKEYGVDMAMVIDSVPASVEELKRELESLLNIGKPLAMDSTIITRALEETFNNGRAQRTAEWLRIHRNGAGLVDQMLEGLENPAFLQAVIHDVRIAPASRFASIVAAVTALKTSEGLADHAMLQTVIKPGKTDFLVMGEDVKAESFGLLYPSSSLRVFLRRQSDGVVTVYLNENKMQEDIDFGKNPSYEAAIPGGRIVFKQGRGHPDQILMTVHNTSQETIKFDPGFSDIGSTTISHKDSILTTMRAIVNEYGDKSGRDHRATLTMLWTRLDNELRDYPEVRFTREELDRWEEHAGIFGKTWQKIRARVDSAMHGGIDFNIQGLATQGEDFVAEIDPKLFEQLESGSFNGIIPVITHVTPVSGWAPILGFEPADAEEVNA